MKVLLFYLVGFLTFGNSCIAGGEPHSALNILPRKAVLNDQDRPGSICERNDSKNRQIWCDHDINTDYTTITPETGVTREFWLQLNQAYLAPDGRKRWALTINGSIPGPTLEVNWGDNVVIHFRNNLPKNVRNGTSMHFHGIRQLYTNPNDGVVSITQCPVPPGDVITYRWRATQYGTTWYHSHIGLQTWEGAFGGIIIHGPASGNYDEDKGTIFLNDWDTKTVDELWEIAQRSGPPTVDNGLVNGINVFGEDGDLAQTGQRFTMSFVPGRSYRLRLGNSACDTHFKFSIDHHTLTVVAADLVPIRPYNTTILDIAIGQRYDVIVHADQESTASSFWLRAILQVTCSKNSNSGNIRGIINYENQETAAEELRTLPTTSPHNYTDSCTDESLTNLIPVIKTNLTLPQEITYNKSLPVGITRDTNNRYKWTLNNTSMQLDWSNPTLRKIVASFPAHDSTTGTSDTDTNYAFPRTDAVIALSEPDCWTLVIIETTLAAPHPIHLHGHDFLIVAQGQGPYRDRYRSGPRPGPGPGPRPPADAGISLTQTPTTGRVSPGENRGENEHRGENEGEGKGSGALMFVSGSLPKRDTALLPASGHLVIAFKTDNPGAWLLHCHIGWHLEQGFGVQFVEKEDEIRRLFGKDWRGMNESMGGKCRKWEEYWGEYGDVNGSGV